MPKDASLSDSCTPDCYSFSRLDAICCCCRYFEASYAEKSLNNECIHIFPIGLGDILLSSGHMLLSYLSNLPETWMPAKQGSNR